MRYCKECGTISEDDGWGYCKDCGINTEPIGDIDEEQAQLFNVTDTDNIRSVNAQLKMTYIDACDKVTKTETMLRKAISARDTAGQIWIKFHKLTRGDIAGRSADADEITGDDELVGFCGMSPADHPGCDSCNSVSCPVKPTATAPDNAWSNDLFDELAGDDDE